MTGLRLIELTLSVVVDRVNSVICMWITAVKDKVRVCYRTHGALQRIMDDCVNVMKNYRLVKYVKEEARYIILDTIDTCT